MSGHEHPPVPPQGKRGPRREQTVPDAVIAAIADSYRGHLTAERAAKAGRGADLRALDAAGLSLAQIAQLLDIPRPTVARLVREARGQD